MSNKRYPAVPTLLAFAILIPFSGAIINLSDPPLKPEVVAILDRPSEPPSEAARRAYVYLLGLQAGERVDPERRGEQEYKRLPTPEFKDAHVDADPWRVDFTGCGTPPGECAVDDLDAIPPAVVADDLNKNKPALDAYLKVTEFGDFDASPARTATLPFSPVTIPGLGIHRLFTLNVAKWFRDGGEVRAWHAIESSNLFYAAVLKRGGELANRVTAARALAMNARVVRRELARRPGRSPSPDLIASFKLPDLHEVLSSALASEVELLHARVARATFSWRRVIVRPRETENVHYDIAVQSLFTDCPHPDAACVPALSYIDDGGRGYVMNQYGHRLLREATAGLNVRATLTAAFEEILTAKSRIPRRALITQRL